jgi:hypothetical protein
MHNWSCLFCPKSDIKLIIGVKFEVNRYKTSIFRISSKMCERSISTTMYNIRTKIHTWANNITPFIMQKLRLRTSDIVKLEHDYIKGIMVFIDTLNNISVISCRSISVYHNWSCDFESCSGEVYSMQYYIIKVGSFLRALRFLPPIKLASTI